MADGFAVFDEFDDGPEEEEEAPEIEEPEFEEVFQSDLTGYECLRRLEGAERRSLPFLGRLAKAKLIAERARQLEIGAPPMIPRDRLRSSRLEEIAKQELRELVLPLKIVRIFPDGCYEVWSLPEFEHIARD